MTILVGDSLDCHHHYATEFGSNPSLERVAEVSPDAFVRCLAVAGEGGLQRRGLCILEGFCPSIEWAGNRYPVQYLGARNAENPQSTGRAVQPKRENRYATQQ